MSYDNLSSVSQNILKFYQQLTGEERRVPFIFGRSNLQSRARTHVVLVKGLHELLGNPTTYPIEPPGP
jgi:hypothetical protein